jgi:hypothetical protein
LDFLIEKTGTETFYGIAKINTQTEFENGFVGLASVSGQQAFVHEVDFENKATTQRKIVPLATQSVDSKGSVNVDSLGNMFITGSNIQLTNA